MKLLIILKNSIFGLVAIIWGIMIFFWEEYLIKAPHELLFTIINPKFGIFLFVLIGIFHIITRFCHNNTLVIVANILLAFTYMLVALTMVYASFYGFAWIALGGIIANQLLNAYLIANGKY